MRWSEIYAKSQARFCHNNGHGCQTAGQLGVGGRGSEWGETSYAKSQARFCHNNGHGCQSAGQLGREGGMLWEGEVG